jgi:hypothetical protein
VVDREVDEVLAATWRITVPFPVSGEPETMLTQLALSLAVQEQLEELAVTLIGTRPPAGGTERLPGATVNAHDVPGWITVTGVPATVRFAVRCEEPVFAVAVKLTVPFPLRFVPLLIVIHELCSVADHVQPEGAATEKVEPPPAAGTDRLVGVTE